MPYFSNGEFLFMIVVLTYIQFLSKRDEINLLAFEGCNFRQLIRVVFWQLQFLPISKDRCH